MTRGCCFIAGDPKDPETVFCNQPAVDGTWCREHRTIVYVARKPAPPDIGGGDPDELEGAAE